MERVGGKVLAGKQYGGLVAHQAGRHQVVGEIVERSLVERLIDGVGGGPDHHRVAIRRRFDHARRTQHAAGSADVFDDDLLAEHLRQSFGDDPPEQIGAAAWNGTTIVTGRSGQVCAAAKLMLLPRNVKTERANDDVSHRS